MRRPWSALLDLVADNKAEPDTFTWAGSGRRFGRCIHCRRLVVRLYEDGPWQHNSTGEARCHVRPGQ